MNTKTISLSFFAGLCLGAASGGCGLLDVDITLQQQSFSKNFGNQSGTVQSVSCTTATDPCPTAATQVNTAISGSGATATGVCDQTSHTCSAQLDATFSAPLNLSQDGSFTNGVAGKAVVIVRKITLKYGIPTNTATFNIPELKLYIAPQGVSSIADSRAVYIDKIPTIPKMQTSADDSGAITVDTSTPAGQRFVYYIQHPTEPFVFLVNGKPTVRAGDALPAGQLTVHVTPQITVGF